MLGVCVGRGGGREGGWKRVGCVLIWGVCVGRGGGGVEEGGVCFYLGVWVGRGGGVVEEGGVCFDLGVCVGMVWDGVRGWA